MCDVPEHMMCLLTMWQVAYVHRVLCLACTWQLLGNAGEHLCRAAL